MGKWSGEDTKCTVMLIFCVCTFYTVDLVRTLRAWPNFIGSTGEVTGKNHGGEYQAPVLGGIDQRSHGVLKEM